MGDINLYKSNALPRLSSLASIPGTTLLRSHGQPTVPSQCHSQRLPSYHATRHEPFVVYTLGNDLDDLRCTIVSIKKP